MRKLLIPVLFFLGLASLRAVVPVPHAEGVTYTLRLSGTGTGVMTFHAEGTNDIAHSVSGTPSESSDMKVALLRPGMRYSVNIATSSGVTGYWLSFMAPRGYSLYVGGLPRDVLHVNTGGGAANTDYDIELRPVGEAAASAFGEFSGIRLGESVNWSVGLSGLRTGRLAGHIVFREKDLTGNPEERARLYYGMLPHANQISAVYDGPSNQHLRQLVPPQGIIDLVDETNGYTMKFYTWGQAYWSGPLWTVSGTPWKTIRVETPGTNQLKITETEGSTVRVSHLSLTAGSVSSGNFTWQLQEGNGSTWLRTTTLTSANVTGGREETIIVRTGGTGGTIVAQTRHRYEAQGWGMELVRTITDPDGAALTTDYAYHNDNTKRGNYRRVKSVTDPTGGWVAYEYYDDWDRRGQLKHQFHPYKDSPALATGASSTVGRVLTHNYEADWSGRHTRRILTEERIENVLTGKTEHSYSDLTGLGEPRVSVTTKAYSSGSSFQTALAQHYRGDAGVDYAGEPYLIKPPDQRHTSYAMTRGAFDNTTRVFTVDAGAYNWRVLQVNGSTSSSGATLVSSYGGQSFEPVYLLANKSTIQAVVRNSPGNVIRTETLVYTGGSSFALVAFEDFYYDHAGRLTKREASNGAVTDYAYANGRLDHTIGADGTRIDYTYDLLGRVATGVRQGAGSRAAVLTGGYTYPAQADITSTYTYNGLNRVTQEVVSGGGHTQTTTRAYDLAGRQTQQISFVGSSHAMTTGFAYSAGGKIVTTTLPGGATRVVETHLDGQVKGVSGSAGVSEDYTHSISSGNRLRRLVYGGNSAAWTDSTWDWLGRPLEEWAPRWDGNNWARVWHYNAQGQLWKMTQPGLAPTLYEYNTLGERTRGGLDLNSNNSLDPAANDRITTSSVDFWFSGSDWWLRSETGTYATASSGTHTVLGTAYERLTGLSGGVQRQTHTYDANGNLTMDWSEVDRTGKLIKRHVLRPDSNIGDQHIAYNGFLSESRDSAGLTQRLEYDGLGRAWKSIDPRKGTTTKAYIAGTNFVSTIADPASVVQATYTYDSSGRVSSVRDALSKYTFYSYTNRGEKYREWGDASVPVEYAYNGMGQQTTMKTFRGGSGWTGGSWPGSPGTADTTTWNYHAPTNLLQSKTDAVSGSVSYTYTVAGQIAQRTWTRGVQTAYSYSSSTGELLGVDYSDSTPDLTYTYNRLGQMASVTDYTGTRTLTHTVSGQLSEETLGSMLQSRKLTYNLATSGVVGRMNGYTLSGASGSGTDLGVSYAYRTDGRLQSVASGKTFSYDYVANSHLVQSITESTTAYSSYRAYEANRDWFQYNNTTTGSTTVSTFQHFFDNLGRIVYYTRSGDIFSRYTGGSLVTVFGYNDRSEVTSEKTYLGWSGVLLTGRDDAYAYDHAGNRTSTTHNGDTATYTSNALNQYTQRTVPSIFDVAGAAASGATVTVNSSSAGITRHGEYFFKGHGLSNGSAPAYTTLTVSDGSTSTNLPAFLAKTPEPFTYDSDGNLTADGRWTYGYNAENRLGWMETLAAAVTAGHPKLGYYFNYDYLGRRVRKIEYTWSGSAWVPGTERRYVYEGWNLIGEYSGTYSGGSFPSASARYFLWGKDLSGTVHGAGGVGGLLMTKEASESYLPAFDTMGNLHAMIRASDRAIVAAYEYDAFGRTVRESGAYAASNPFRFSTKYTDIETGLIYYGLRYYHPSMGRFINRDPLGERGGLNLYGFVRNNGVNRADLLGMTPILDNDVIGRDGGPINRWDALPGLVAPSGMSADEEWYGSYVPAGGGDGFNYGFDSMAVYDDFGRSLGLTSSEAIFSTYAPAYSQVMLENYFLSQNAEAIIQAVQTLGEEPSQVESTEPTEGQENASTEFQSVSVGWQGTIFIPTPKALAAGFSSSFNFGVVSDGSLKNSRLQVSFNISPIVGIGAAVYQGLTVGAGRSTQSPSTGFAVDGSFHAEAGLGAGPKIFNAAVDWKPGESLSGSPPLQEGSMRGTLSGGFAAYGAIGGTGSLNATSPTFSNIVEAIRSPFSILKTD